MSGCMGEDVSVDHDFGVRPGYWSVARRVAELMTTSSDSAKLPRGFHRWGGTSTNGWFPYNWMVLTWGYLLFSATQGPSGSDF